MKNHASVIGQPLLHPIALFFAVILGLNDHWWKEAYGNWLTGKLSDFAGLVVFPLVLFSLVQLGWFLRTGQKSPTRTSLFLIIATVGLFFSMMKLFEPAGDVYRFLMALIHTPVQSWTHPASAYKAIHHVTDSTDLVALPSLAIAFVLAKPHCQPKN